MKSIIVLILFAFANTMFAVEFEGEAKKFIKQGKFICPSTGLSFKTPSLNSKKLRIQYAERTPGITWQLMFGADYGFGIAVTYTKIRAEYPKNDLVLDRIASNIKKQMRLEGAFLEWCGFLSDKKGKVLQCIITYPEAGQTVSVRNVWLGSMESVRQDVFCVRQYIVRNGYLLEFNVYIPQLLPSGSFNYDKILQPWIKELHSFVKGCSIIKEKDNYETQIKNFKKQKTYFRFNFKDPSKG